MSLNQGTWFCSLCEQIHPDPLSWECQQWSSRQEFWTVLWQGRLDPLGCGINAPLSWSEIQLGALSTQQKCCSFCACWAIVGSWWKSSSVLDPLLWQHSSSQSVPLGTVWVSLGPALWPAPAGGHRNSSMWRAMSLVTWEFPGKDNLLKLNFNTIRGEITVWKH